MVCLMGSKDVMCLANNAHFKITSVFLSGSYNESILTPLYRFPTNAWPSEIAQPYQPKVYRPPQSGPPIVKITSCESTFAALSDLGDVFTFTINADASSRGKFVPVKPQRIWAIRKQMSAVVVRTFHIRTFDPFLRTISCRTLHLVLMEDSSYVPSLDTYSFARACQSLAGPTDDGKHQPLVPSPPTTKRSSSSGYRHSRELLKSAPTAPAHMLLFVLMSSPHP